jgi:hypothetical protein
MRANKIVNYIICHWHRKIKIEGNTQKVIEKLVALRLE